MAVNRYAAKCATCRNRVPSRGGSLTKINGRWVVRHLDCSSEGRPKVMTIGIGGNTYIRNTSGRCEDAPCCGCCSI